MSVQYIDVGHHDWWCQVHKRPATHLQVREDGRQQMVCDPKLSGITMPCSARYFRCFGTMLLDYNKEFPA